MPLITRHTEGRCLGRKWPHLLVLGRGGLSGMLCLCFSHPEASRAAQFHIPRARKPLPMWLPMPMTFQEPSLDSELFEHYDLLLSLHSLSQGLAASRCPFIVEWMSRYWNFSSSSLHLLCFSFSITFLSIFHPSGLI